MNCQFCKTHISKEFVYLINNNICGACGKQLMAQDSLAGFLGLKELLKSYVSDSDKIASLIVSNFDVKQRFVSEQISINEEKISDNEQVELDARERAKLIEQQKLQKLKDEAFAEANYRAKLANALSDNPSDDVEDEALIQETSVNLQQTRNAVYQSDSDLDLDQVQVALENHKKKRGPGALPGYKGPVITRNG